MNIQTYYNRTYVEKPIEFDLNDSVTDQSFKMSTDVDYLLSHMAGQSRTPLYGVQSDMTFEDWSNEMAMVKRRFLHLSADEQSRFGNAQNFLMWCSNPNNYKEVLPSNLKKVLDEENELKMQKLKMDDEERFVKKLAEAIKE